MKVTLRHDDSVTCLCERVLMRGVIEKSKNDD